jgi:hypothetical protein
MKTVAILVNEAKEDIKNKRKQGTKKRKDGRNESWEKGRKTKKHGTKSREKAGNR